MDSQRQNILVSSIYHAAAGMENWKGPLDEIAAVLSLWAIQIIGIDKRSQSLLFSFEGGSTLLPHVNFDYLRTYHPLNPRLAPALALKESEWMHCHELFDEEYVAHDRFYQEFLIPYGGRYLSGTKIIDTDETLVLLGAMRGNGSDPLGRGDIDWLSDIRHHFSQALKLHLHLKNIYARVGAGVELLNQFRYPMYLIDEQRTIHFKNTAANTNPACTAFFHCEGERFRCKNSRSDNELLLALRELDLTPKSTDARKSKMLVNLRTGSGDAQAIAFVIAIRPEVVLNSFGHLPTALVILNIKNPEDAIDPFIIAEAFNFTPAEARIAALIAQGLELETVASKFKISINTARTHLYSAFSKAGVSRQAELSALLSSLLAF